MLRHGVNETTVLPIAEKSNSHDFRSYVPANFALDSTGQYLFCVNYLYPDIPSPREVWVFSTDLAAFPPPPVPTQNLANISTRVNVNTGEGSMIGGFIIDGATPKKVLNQGSRPFPHPHRRARRPGALFT